jgi:hypothetical protein
LSLFGPLLGLRVERHRRLGALGVPLLGHLDRQPVLLGILGNTPARLEVADYLLERDPVVRSRERVRAIRRERSDQVFRGSRGCRRWLGCSPASSAPAPASALRICLRIRLLAGGARLLLLTGPLGPSTFAASTSPPPRLAHLAPPSYRRTGRREHPTTTSRGRSSRALPAGRREQRSPRSPEVSSGPLARPLFEKA